MERKNTTLFGALALLTALAILAGCTKGNGRDESGKQVRISASLGGVSTRTAFGEEASTQLKINWVLGDCFTVWSDKARHYSDASRQTADYIVKQRDAEPKETMKDRAIVDPCDLNGLLWSAAGGAHSFYARFPADESKMDNEKMTAEIPATQALTWNGLTGKTDMKYAFMFASAPSQAFDTAVRLDFYPKFTAFEFTVSPGDNESISLTSFTFKSSSQPVAGRFQLAYADQTVTPLDNDATTITVDLTGKTLTTGNVLKITIFALPTALTNLEVTFQGTEIGTRVLKLNKGGSPITFAACKLHRLTGISLPKWLGAEGEDVIWDQESFGQDIVWDN